MQKRKSAVANKTVKHKSRGCIFCQYKRINSSKRRTNSRKAQFIITRLGDGQNNLNSTLYIVVKHPSRFCEYCHEPEMREHVLF